MRRSWLQPPRLRIGPDVEGERHATWLELFYDLVFVAAVFQLSENLNRDISLQGFARFVVLFVPVWWSWIGAAFYATRFDTDDTVHRLFTMLMMIAVAAMAVNVRSGLSNSSAGFAASYGVVGLLVVAEYVRAGRYVPEARPLTSRYSKGFALSAVCWLASAFVPIPIRFVLWAAGFAVGFGTPIFAGQLHSRLAPHPSHLPERFGLFTLIVLGESVVGAVSAVSGHRWNVPSGITAALGLCTAFGLWWIYFDSVAGTAILAAREAGRIATYQIWMYSHLPLAIGLTAVGVGITQAVLLAPVVIPGSLRWLTFGSTAICFLALTAIHLTTTTPRTRRPIEAGAAYRGAGALLMLALAASGLRMTAMALTGILALSCAVMVVADFYEQQQH